MHRQGAAVGMRWLQGSIEIDRPVGISGRHERQAHVAQRRAADAQSLAHPLEPTAGDGWTPASVTPVRSRNEGGFIGSSLQFALGGVAEPPGQRLSRGQVDRLAPYFAARFGLDEGFVRAELAKVYLYVGGPSTTAQQAMTIGHHVFLPDEDSLRRILAPGGRRWLTHELAHTMQFLAYHDGRPHDFLADYLISTVVGRDPQRPGTGTGPPVWGALFTGLRAAGRSEADLGSGARGPRDHLVATVVPAAALSIPVALTAAGGLAAGRATTGLDLLGTGRAASLAGAAIAAPAIGGAVLGGALSGAGTGWAPAGGAALGGAVAGLALWRGGAFAAGGGGTAGISRAFGRTGAIALAAGVAAGGAAIGAVSAAASANTVRGFSSSAHLLHSLQAGQPGEAPELLSWQDAVHDAHWAEIDAEALARGFTHGRTPPPPAGSPPVAGRIPDEADDGELQADVRARLDWGVRLPLLLGIPAAVGAGAGALGVRTGAAILRSAVRDGHAPGRTLREALRVLGSQQRGVTNSLGIGAAVTVAPLVAGGLLAPLAYDVTGSEAVARAGGAAAGAVVAGAILPLLLRGRGSSMRATGGKVAAGMAIAGAAGLLAGGSATDALRPRPRTYDVHGPR